jgi:hypothetical protein
VTAHCGQSSLTEEVKYHGKKFRKAQTQFVENHSHYTQLKENYMKELTQNIDERQQVMERTEQALETIIQLGEYLTGFIFDKVGEREGEYQIDMLHQILLIAGRTRHRILKITDPGLQATV